MHILTCSVDLAHRIKWTEQAEQITDLHLFQGDVKKTKKHRAHWMLNGISIEHLCTAASFKQAIHSRGTSDDLSQCSQSTGDTQELSSTSHQAPLPPSGGLETGGALLLKFSYPEAKTFNGHCFACYMRRWHYNHLSRPKTGLWQLRQAIHYSIILNISGDRQDARAINI